MYKKIIDFPNPPILKKSKNAIPILIEKDVESLNDKLSKEDINFVKNLCKSSYYKNTIILPDKNGNISLVIIFRNDTEDFFIGNEISKLPKGIYFIKNELDISQTEEIFIGFGLASYSFNFYNQRNLFNVKLLISKNLDYKKIFNFLTSEYMVRNLVNTPASELGPETFEKFLNLFSKRYNFTFRSYSERKYLKKNFPLIFEVGKGSFEKPRLIEMTFGTKTNFKVTLIGKGVCFDSGGLNIKPSVSMNTMKKDMGGAANIIGLAKLIVSYNLPVYLRVLIPIVENSISKESFRPSDILTSRNGTTIEINNTDAEGRLILADALSYADEEKFDLLICMATLTGAARVALGEDIAPFFTNNENLAKVVIEKSKECFDPVWRLPFYYPYRNSIKPEIANLDNAPKGGMAGSIKAALFLKEFLKNDENFIFFDIFSWSNSNKPGKAKGGIMQGVRSLFLLIEKIC